MTTLEHPIEHREEHVGVAGLEAIAGIVGAILAIVAMAGVIPQYTAPVAIIALGVLFLVLGGAGRLVRREVAAEEELPVPFIAGAVGIVLGILALLNLAPVALVSTAVLVFGVAALVGGIMPGRQVETKQLQISGSGLLVGIGVITLGILAVVGVNPLVLTMTAVLTLGVLMFLHAAMLSGRLMSALRH